MAVRIIDVDIKTDKTWLEIKNGHEDWNKIKSGNIAWWILKQTTKTGHTVGIDVLAVENKWTGLVLAYKNWYRVINNFSTWNSLKNW